MIKKEFYVLEDLNTHKYWHIQKAWWVESPFVASFSPCTDEEYKKLASRISSKRFKEMQQRHAKTWEYWPWKEDHKLGIAKITYICEDGKEPDNNEEDFFS